MCVPGFLRDNIVQKSAGVSDLLSGRTLCLCTYSVLHCIACDQLHLKKEKKLSLINTDWIFGLLYFVCLPEHMHYSVDIVFQASL